MQSVENNSLTLVTGAAGWLGQNVVEAALEGIAEHPALRDPPQNRRLRCLVLPGQGRSLLERWGERIELVEGDLRNPEVCQRLCQNARGAVLLHLAGIIHPGKVAEFYQINLEATQSLLSAAASAGVKRAVVMSSNSPLGCNPFREHLFDEESAYNPYMHYGRSKMQMELAVRELQKRGEIETVLIRAPWFYGPHQPARQGLFFRMIRDGKIPIVGDGQNRRSMAYTGNLAQGVLLASDNPSAAGQIYWIADDRAYSMNEIIDTVERLLETEFAEVCAHKRIRLPGIFSDLAWVADQSLQSLGLYHQKIHVLSEMNKTIACSVAKAKRELGYLPAVALEEGMRRSLAWMRSVGQWL